MAHHRLLKMFHHPSCYYLSVFCMQIADSSYIQIIHDFSAWVVYDSQTVNNRIFKKKTKKLFILNVAF